VNSLEFEGYFLIGWTEAGGSLRRRAWRSL